MGKVLSLNALVNVRRKQRRLGRKVVFTNGAFDIIHRGHVEYLTKAKQLGDVLIVGLNTDSSIRRIKGNGRPINKNADRGAVLAALEPVDYVCFFDEDTPARIIDRLVPDVLVKGADWKVGEIVGRETVVQHGGKVRTIRLTSGRSTSNVIQRVLQVYGSASFRKSRGR